MKKDPKVFLIHINENIESIEKYTKDLDQRSFLEYKNEIVQDAVLRKIEIIGEAARNIPEDFKNLHSEIAWEKIAGMRNKLIHEYFGVDLELVWEVVKKDIPQLKTHIDDILKTML